MLRKRGIIWAILLIALSMGLLTTAVAMAAAGDINTVASTEIASFGGDGGPATSAPLWGPKKVAVDTSGNLFFVDSNNHRVRKVDTSGVITTVAGNGAPTFGGDGGPATEAQLNFPYGVAVDSSGNLFIADRNNNRIRRVDTSANISTVAGTGTSGFAGDGGSATGANLQAPRDVAVDSFGNLFIADSNNHRIRKVDTSGNITTVAGTGATGLGQGGFSGDGGPATSAQLDAPEGIAVDSFGNPFIADTQNQRIRKIDTAGNIITVAGTTTFGFSGDGGPAINAQLKAPRGVAVDSSGNLFIADAFNYRIRKVDTSGNISTVAGNGTQGFFGDGGSATGAQLDQPSGVAVDSSGDLFIADSSNHRIRKVEAVAAAAPPVPAVSTWGLLGLAVLMASAASVVMLGIGAPKQESVT